jgi:phosphomannomutase
MDIMKKEKHIFDKELLKKYDIRGVYGKNLTEEDAYFLGKSFTMLLRENKSPLKVCVGYDGRVSSPALENALVEGLIESGVNVKRIGLVPTPVLYFATYFVEGYKSGIMVTGSHNPSGHNGFKLVMNNSPVYDQEILEIANIAESGDFINQKGSKSDIDVVEAYIEKLLELSIPHNMLQNLVMVWDPGSGAAGEVVKRLSQRLPGVHKVINGDIDGTFPSHHPDPSVPENLTQLIEEVKREEASLGIAFDGDADRIGVVDNKGRILFGDHLLMIYARDVLRRVPNAKIIADVKTSQVVFEKIKEWGGTPIMWNTGHSLIKQKMKQEKAVLAGEMSGHIFFADNYYGYDDGIFAACRLFKIIASQKASLEEIYNELPKTSTTPEIRIFCKQERKFEIIEEITTYMTKLNMEFNDLDGIRVHSELGWWLLRASNTEDCLVARVESYTSEGLPKLCRDLVYMLNKVEYDLDVSSLTRYFQP